MGSVFIGRGDCHLGRIKTDAEGNVVEKTSAKWEPNNVGVCVAICDMDPDKMEPTGPAEVFGDWDAAHFLPRVLEKLGPGRSPNVPNFRAILKMAMDNGQGKFYFCDFCERFGNACRNCIVTEWLEDIK